LTAKIKSIGLSFPLWFIFSSIIHFDGSRHIWRDRMMHRDRHDRQALGRLSFFRFLRRVKRDDSGATAIEFSLVALPFFALMFAIIETSFTFFTQQSLDTAVEIVARQIAVGALTEANTNKEQIKEHICDKIVGFFDCSGKLKVDVRPYDRWDANRPSMTIEDGTIDSEQFDFKTGSASKIMLLRAGFVHKSFTDFFAPTTSGLPSGSRLILSTAAFRVEPFDGEQSFRAKIGRRP
jgi:Flp pilus assembly protein TadG